MTEGCYIVLINGTKFDWIKFNVQNNKMNTWNKKFPQSITAGTYVEVYVELTKKNLNDSNNDDAYEEICYSVSEYSFQIRAITEQTFNVKFCYVNFSNLGSFSADLGWCKDGYIPLIISGQHNRFISTGSFQGATSWMFDNLGDFGDRKLNEICIAGSHDAGMSNCHDGTVVATVSNTKTQNFDILKQLKSGSRYFDIRPIIGDDQFFTGHYCELYITFQGERGQSIESIVKQVNEFTLKSQELVILNLSHTLNTDLGSEYYREFNQIEWNRLFLVLSQIKNLFVSKDGGQINLTEIPLRQFIEHKSAVCVIVETGGVDLGTYHHRGFYHRDELDVFNKYSNTDHLEKMIADQTTKMREQQNSYFLLSWTLTEHLTELIFGTIEKLAKKANGSLHKFLPCVKNDNVYPNIIYVDYFDSNATAMALLVNSFARLKR